MRHDNIDGQGATILNGITYPSADGTNGQVITTNGGGVLSFTTVGGGGGLGDVGRGAQVTISAALNLIPAFTNTALNWDAEDFDDLTFHDNVTLNTRLTVPAGVTRVRIDAHIEVVSDFNAATGILTINKNGAALKEFNIPSNAESQSLAIYTVDTCVATDFYEIDIFHEAGFSIDMSSTIQFFTITVLR